MSDLTPEQWEKRFTILAAEFIDTNDRITKQQEEITHLQGRLERLANPDTIHWENYLTINDLAGFHSAYVELCARIQYARDSLEVNNENNAK